MIKCVLYTYKIENPDGADIHTVSSHKLWVNLISFDFFLLYVPLNNLSFQSFWDGAAVSGYLPVLWEHQSVLLKDTIRRLWGSNP